MILTERNFYLFLSILLLTGYSWVFYNSNSNQDASFELCYIKKTLSIPCPSCGITRSVVNIFNANFEKAFFINPLGYLVSVIMLISPIWIMFDILSYRKTFYFHYIKLENIFVKPLIFIPLLVLFGINWIWNIYKNI